MKRPDLPGAPALELRRRHHNEGAPSFAHFAKGGHDAAVTPSSLSQQFLWIYAPIASGQSARSRRTFPQRTLAQRSPVTDTSTEQCENDDDRSGAEVCPAVGPSDHPDH